MAMTEETKDVVRIMTEKDFIKHILKLKRNKDLADSDIAKKCKLSRAHVTRIFGGAPVSDKMLEAYGYVRRVVKYTTNTKLKKKSEYRHYKQHRITDEE